MDERARIESARLAFAKVTGSLEDAVVAAADAQSVSDVAAAQRSCDRLIARLEASLRQLRRLLRSLG